MEKRLFDLLDLTFFFFLLKLLLCSSGVRVGGGGEGGDNSLLEKKHNRVCLCGSINPAIRPSSHLSKKFFWTEEAPQKMCMKEEKKHKLHTG